MCGDGICIVIDFLAQIALAVVVFLLIRKVGFNSAAAKWAYIIPMAWIADFAISMMEFDKGGLFSGPESLGLPFDIIGLLAPFSAAIVLLVFLKSDWPLLRAKEDEARLRSPR
ncbi:hypothetical protein CKO42_08285 [Lamprobacter modestohalophilus]|uniref:Uncharacterized protein n=1 Tax=Lamprobacter modestohalophilus TaxID=1064514 RepID=A0A9X1B3W8_9GAMM|nr:hypothetical protein [Lamprobacter modestohalophilus]MBK1618434.1 hypothetical protein [Lamprobacter modestohalophilus]